MSSHDEFKEIAHSGGQLVIHIGPDSRGNRGYQLKWQHSRPVAHALFAVYALPEGIPVEQIRLGGIGSPWNPAPFPNCFTVFIASDSEGKFGHQCPDCSQYWRGNGGAVFCPYCGIRGNTIDFLTKSQRSYVEQYCTRMREVLGNDIDGEYIIDMDAVADSVGKEADKPPFYYAEESQQNKFACDACGTFNDILGRFGYCSICRTRNDLQELSSRILPQIRDRINCGGPYEDCVRDSVATFDSFVGRFVEQLVLNVPLTISRRNRFSNRRFHTLKLVATDLKEVFGIDIVNGLKPEDIDFSQLMFHRRHVYEHRGGEADEKYIADSGDSTVRLKQALRESVESAHRIVGLIFKMASNLHRDFHEIFPPEEKPIQQHRRN